MWGERDYRKQKASIFCKAPNILLHLALVWMSGAQTSRCRCQFKRFCKLVKCQSSTYGWWVDFLDSFWLVKFHQGQEPNYVPRLLKPSCKKRELVRGMLTCPTPCESYCWGLFFTPSGAARNSKPKITSVKVHKRCSAATACVFCMKAHEKRSICSHGQNKFLLGFVMPVKVTKVMLWKLYFNLQICDAIFLSRI